MNINRNAKVGPEVQSPGDDVTTAHERASMRWKAVKNSIRRKTMAERMMDDMRQKNGAIHQGELDHIDIVRHFQTRIYNQNDALDDDAAMDRRDVNAVSPTSQKLHMWDVTRTFSDSLKEGRGASDIPQQSRCCAAKACRGGWKKSLRLGGMARKWIDCILCILIYYRCISASTLLAFRPSHISPSIRFGESLVEILFLIDAILLFPALRCATVEDFIMTAPTPRMAERRLWWMKFSFYLTSSLRCH